MGDANNNDVAGAVDTGGTEENEQDSIQSDETQTSDNVNLTEETTDKEFSIILPSSSEEGILINSEDDDYDEDKIIISLDIPHTIMSGVLHIYANNVKLKDFTVEYDEDLSYNEDNDWKYNILLSDLDLTGINTEDKIVFLFNVNDETVYRLNATIIITGEYKLYFTNLQVVSTNTSTESSSSSTDDENWEPSLIVDGNEDKTFQVRVFHEQNNEVYGAEVVLFDSKDVIETILITDNVKLESFNRLVENMEKCYVPYTQDDLDNLNIYKNLATGEISESDEEYKFMSWSKLHDKQDLKTILENNISISDEKEESYTNDNYTIINATHLNGFASDDFVKKGESVGNYLQESHALRVASTNTLGHVLIVDNLNEYQLDGGRVLSANQGRVLKENINSLDSKINNSWSSEKKINQYISYKVNPLLRLFVCIYKRSNYKGFQSETGTRLLHSSDNGIPTEYRPLGNVTTPLTRGDIILYYNTDGAVYINSLTRQNSIDINVQVQWHY